jgi:two-component system cell cycle sensor histidine kinase/response regulator CckA
VTNSRALVQFVIAATAGQVALAAVLAIMLGGFHRLYRHAYLRHWSLSWLALVVYIVTASAAEITNGEPPSLGVRVPLAAVALVAGYLQIVWLMLGAWGLATGVEVPRRTVWRAEAGGVAAGLVSLGPALAGATHPSMVGVRCAVAAIACWASALALLRRHDRIVLGPTFAGLALAVYGTDQAAYVALGFAPAVTQLARLPLLMTFDFLATAVIGVALVSWLLQGERERLGAAWDLARSREKAQECVYRISEAARNVLDLSELFASIHGILGEVLPARNFYVALLDRSSGLLTFPYFVDERDPTPLPKPLGRGLTEYVLRTREPLLATPQVFQSLCARGEVELIASDSVDWLGAPLLAHGEPIGVAAIQTYDPAVRLGPDERDLFVFVSEQVASAIEARRTEDALRQSEARLRLAIEQVPAVLWTTDEELRFTSSLGAGLSGLGLAAGQVVGTSVAEFLGGSSPALFHHSLALRGESASFDHEMAGRSFIAHVEPLRDAQGAVRGTVGIALDVTNQRRADQALRESEVRLRQVINLVPHFIFAKDGDGRFIFANRAVADAYGTTVDRLIGRTDADFARSAAEAAGFRNDDLEVMRTGEAKVVDEKITDSRGGLRYLQTTKIPFVFSGTGRPAVLGVSIDVTERRAAEETLRRAAKEESLTVLAGGVAHDFNNLLAAILGHAALSLKLLPAGSAARRHIEKAAAAVERASDLTRQMLAYSGRGHFVVEPTDFNALVRENLPLLEVALPKNVRLEARLDPDLPPVEADVGQIQQVLMNLVINAAEAIGETGGRVTLATGTREVGSGDTALWKASGQPLAPGRYVSLEVRDDGPGMDPATVDRIFEPFFTTKFTGRGLGLAAVLGVVRGHRGALSVESAPGRGTVFRLLFTPGRRETGVEPGPAARPSSVAAVTLLLVDDEEVVRDMVSEVLVSEGIRVLCAADGARGAELFHERRREIDIVLLDLSMPGLSGEQTYARLCEIEPAVKVILSSGYDQHEAARRFGGKGPAGFIQKPYRPQQLVAEIERCLRRPKAAVQRDSAS